MIKYIICEDNSNFLQKISEVVHKTMKMYKFDYKIHKFQGYKPEIESLISDESDQKIYILDVEMPEVSGLEIASMIREEDTKSTIIFLTSYPEYKNDVFYSRLLALDYIQKGPLWGNRLEDTIKHTIKNINKGKALVFKYNGHAYRVEYNDINYIEKVQEHRKCIIYTKDGKKYQVTSTLKELQPKLTSTFLQTHKSFILNVKNIKHIDYPNNVVTFNNNFKAYLISNRGKRELKEYVKNH